MTPFLILPTPVHSRNFSIASTNLSSPKSFLTDVLPCLTISLPIPKQRPLRPFYISPPDMTLTLPEISPTSFHKFLISSFHVLHSLKRCSLVCLPPPHHQHPSDSTQPNFSFKNGAIIACPDESWKKREASSFGACRRPDGILSCVPTLGTKKDLPP